MNTRKRPRWILYLVMDAWDVGEHEDDRNVINESFFKCQKYPNYTVTKFKAHFCAQGDQKLEVIDFFETYASVVQ